ncbi:hypothetical protein H1Z61_15845 [Bacillus aquiflavi]|uniref:Lipoprotein n=1 Tax=Bacillus aquiflavi TaxID=2672567 RepID=A0A6B3W4K7_9BACI|nr:hypothetical protein [Bacillus aquiflavi]MBA4538560.1 hypothetical protein [Bacillus aquiflavi]NEY82923.1 hypothetical protein [Bacillus aquiflavi]UAC48025.1 hypothetical protein K6959_15765 [Bacillus aquiflavi]
MKKVFMQFLFLVSISFLLVGCSAGNKKFNDKNWTDHLAKTQKIEVTSPNEDNVITTISEDQEVKNFIDSLKLNEWKSKEIPSGAVEGNTKCTKKIRLQFLN